MSQPEPTTPPKTEPKPNVPMLLAQAKVAEGIIANLRNQCASLMCERDQLHAALHAMAMAQDKEAGAGAPPTP